jgi:hypothetical protein
MPIYLALDDDPAPVTPQSRKVRAQDVATLLWEHQIPRDESTLVALVQLGWSVAVELALNRWRLSRAPLSVTSPLATDR